MILKIKLDFFWRYIDLLIKDTILCKEIKVKNELADLEMIIGEISFGGKNVQIISLYIPPGINKINPDLLNYCDSVGDFILIGDLNAKINTFGPSNKVGKDLENWLRVGKGLVVNKKNHATFHKYKYVEKDGLKVKEKTYESTIDLIITNDNIRQTLLNFESLSISAAHDEELLWFHSPITCTFQVGSVKKKEK